MTKTLNEVVEIYNKINTDGDYGMPKLSAKDCTGVYKYKDYTEYFFADFYECGDYNDVHFSLAYHAYDDPDARNIWIIYDSDGSCLYNTALCRNILTYFR